MLAALCRFAAFAPALSVLAWWETLLCLPAERCPDTPADALILTDPVTGSTVAMYPASSLR